MSCILIISPEPWDGHFVSKHHYAITLASKGNKVYFLNPPNNKLNGIEVSQTKYSNLWSISSPQVAKGLRFYPRLIRTFIERKWLNNLEKIIKNHFSIIWLFENSRFYNMQFAHNCLKIYHQVDLNQNFHTSKAAKSADICFCTTDYILKEIKPHNANVYKIHHGVDLSHKVIKLLKQQIANFKVNGVNVAYVGNLAMKYMDVDILADLVDSFPTIHFQFVGGYDDKTPLYNKCKKNENISWWGKIDSKLIPNVLDYCDVVLVSYQTDYFIDQASPHKIMEYLASGKVIASTYTDEYKDKRNLIEMVDNSEDYVKHFKKIINNLALYNSKERQQERVAFANENSYEKKLEEVSLLLRKCNLKGY